MIITWIIIIINPLTARVVKMILQPVFSIFPCSPLPSGTCRTPGLSFPWCCLPTSSSVCLVFFPLSLCLSKWFWPDLMNGRHDHTTAVCVTTSPHHNYYIIQSWSVTIDIVLIGFSQYVGVEVSCRVKNSMSGLFSVLAIFRTRQTPLLTSPKSECSCQSSG